MTTSNPYDVTPYPGNAYASTHPSRLAAIAALFGQPCAAPASGRTLEIGCASGENLLPMAAAFPQARFIGLDLSQVQIDAARAAQQELGLANIEFICGDILTASASELGKFDYVIAHGIYSWLPPAVQTAMLALCRDCLAEGGVAYVSYNTLPGWHMRGIIRDMMLFHAELYPNPQAQVQQAKLLLDFMVAHVPAESNPYGQYLRSELQMVSQVSANYLAHDHLEVHNEALYFRDFMVRARAAGLDYLGESEFASMAGAGIAPAALAQLRAEITDIVRQEQYFDFMRNRTFRMTLLMHGGTAINRNLAATSLAGLYVTSALAPAGAVDLADNSSARFLVGSSGSGLETGNPVTKAALQLLHECAPAAMVFEDLVDAARARLPATPLAKLSLEQHRELLANDLLVAYSHPGQVGLDAADFAVERYTGGEEEQRLYASPYARWQAARTNAVTNAFHLPILLSDAGRLVLPLLDGTRDRAALQSAFHQLVADGKFVILQEGKPVPPAATAPLERAALDAVLSYLSQWAMLCRAPQPSGAVPVPVVTPSAAKQSRHVSPAAK